MAFLYDEIRIHGRAASLRTRARRIIGLRYDLGCGEATADDADTLHGRRGGHFNHAPPIVKALGVGTAEFAAEDGPRLRFIRSISKNAAVFNQLVRDFLLEIGYAK